MAPPAAVLVLAAAPRLERFRRLALTGSPDGISPYPGTNQYAAGTGISGISGVVTSTPAAQASTAAPTAPTPKWAQHLAQQLLITLWRLHSCGVLPAPPPPAAPSHVPTSSNGRTPELAALDHSLFTADHSLFTAETGSHLTGSQSSTSTLRRSRTGMALPHSADGTLPPRPPRAAGATMPTYTMAATTSMPRLMPQGSLQRPLGGRLPTVGQLPFRTLIGKLPGHDNEGGESLASIAPPLPTPKPPGLTPGSRRTAKPKPPPRESAIKQSLGLTHSKSAPGFY